MKGAPQVLGSAPWIISPLIVSLRIISLLIFHYVVVSYRQSLEILIILNIGLFTLVKNNMYFIIHFHKHASN
jgi:hypothetical protein